ncbi:MAG: 4-phosphopantetheinyl transferase [Verrucomicrobiales bacterium]|nr:4-phosphopantetheinyl transferase [Verrucomicrobiales bacterium]
MPAPMQPLSNIEHLWRPATTAPPLRPDEVHVWSVSLCIEAETLDAMRNVLSADELSRCERSPLVHEQNRFIAGRGSLRHILASYVDTAPAAVQFGYGHAGKPYLLHPAHDLRFNISHSSDLALIAVSVQSDIGVDVELMNEMPEMSEIAVRFFSDAARKQFLSAPAEDRLETFYKCWTEKESISKCTGQGIVEEHPVAADDIAVIPLTPAVGYAASLAIKGPVRNVRTWRWSPALSVDAELPCAAATGGFLYCR